MLTSHLHILPNTFSHSFTTHNSNIKEIGDGCVLRPLPFHTSQTHILSDLTQTHTELLHIQSVFIITHKPDGANMLTSQLHILSNTFSHSLTTHNSNCREIGEWSLLSHISYTHLTILTLSHIIDSPRLHRRAIHMLSLPLILIHHSHSYTTSSFFLSLLFIVQWH